MDVDRKLSAGHKSVHLHYVYIVALKPLIHVYNRLHSLINNKTKQNPFIINQVTEMEWYKY